MTPLEALALFAVAAGLLTVTPGLDVALVLRTAAVEGERPATLAALGICSGCLLWGLAVAFGVGVLVTASEFAYAVLRWIGAAYLFYLGAGMAFRPRRRLETVTDLPPARGCNGSGRWFLRGLLTNLLNPKVGVFYVTFLPQFVPPGVDVSSFIVLLTAIHAAEGVTWLALLVVATRSLALVLQRPAVILALDRVTGAALILCGLRLVLEARY